MLGAKGSVVLQRGEYFPYNDTGVTRSGVFTFLNERFRLGLETPVIKRDFKPLVRSEVTVWDDAHSALPSGDPAFEKRLLRRLAEDDDAQVTAAPPTVGVLVGRTRDRVGDVTWDVREKTEYAGRMRLHLLRRYAPEPVALGLLGGRRLRNIKAGGRCGGGFSCRLRFVRRFDRMTLPSVRRTAAIVSER